MPGPFRSRRQLLQGGLGLAGLSLVSGCGVVSLSWQQMVTVPRIGYLTLTTTDAAEIAAFRDGLRELGYVEGQNIALEVRRAESIEQFAALAAQLVALPVDLILTSGGTASTQAAMGATHTIPIVFLAADPVRSGLVASLAQPGGNVTGLSSLAPQVMGKRLQLLQELVPGVSKVMFLSNTTAAEATGGTQEAQQAARSLGVQLLVPNIGTVADLADALHAAALNHAEALWVSPSPFIGGEVGQIMELATAERLPVLSGTRIFADAGGLLSYGPSQLAQFRRAATHVDKILKGAKPGDVPVEQPTTFDFVINLKTARLLGITVPQSVLQQATEVIQ